VTPKHPSDGGPKNKRRFVLDLKSIFVRRVGSRSILSPLAAEKVDPHTRGYFIAGLYMILYAIMTSFLCSFEADMLVLIVLPL
jgi:hypothetical protein